MCDEHIDALLIINKVMKNTCFKHASGVQTFSLASVFFLHLTVTVISSNEIYHQICTYHYHNQHVGFPNGAGSANTSEEPDFFLVFDGVLVVLSIALYVLLWFFFVLLSLK